MSSSSTQPTKTNLVQDQSFTTRRSSMRTSAKRSMVCMVLLAVLFASTAWAVEFTTNFTVAASTVLPVLKTRTNAVMSSPIGPTTTGNREVMLRVADPTVVFEPFQDEYGVINIPLGWFGPLTIHVRQAVRNDTPNVLTISGAYPTTFNCKFYKTKGMPYAPSYSMKGVALFDRADTRTSDSFTLQPYETRTQPFSDLTLAKPFTHVYGGFTYSGVLYQDAPLSIGDTTWNAVNNKVSSIVVNPVPVTPADPTVGPTVPIDDFVTPPTAPGTNTTYIDIEVDIKPCHAVGAINRLSKGVIPILIKYGVSYNVADIDPATVIFATTLPVKWHYTGHGLMLFYDTRRCNIPDGATSLKVAGKFVNGTLFTGADAVKIVK